jgi:formate hydrogenlyase transcriptional activator
LDAAFPSAANLRTLLTLFSRESTETAHRDYNLRMAAATDGSSRPEQALDIRLAVDAIPALAWSSHSDGSVDFVNQRWREYTGLSPKESYGRGWETAIHPDDLATLAEKWEALDDANAWRECEVRLRRSDGVFRWFSFRREPLRDETGAVTRWYGTGIDIDHTKQKETLHAAEKRTLEMVADGASLREVLDQLCSSVEVQVAPSVTTVLVMDADGKRLWQGGGPRVPQEWISTIIPVPVAFEAGLCGTAAFLKERVIVPDVATEPNWPDQYRDLAIRNGIRAAWSEPILTKDNEVLGTFALYSHEARVPTEEDLALIKGAGHIGRIAIERRRTEEALREIEERFRQMADALPEVMWITALDPEKVLYVSPSFEHIWGLRVEDIYKDPRLWTQTIHPDDRDRISDTFTRWISGENVSYHDVEFRIVQPNGAIRWIHERGVLTRNEHGKPYRVSGISTDITERKQAEQDLRRSEMEARQITDAIPQTIIVLNPDGKPIYANRVALEYTGFSLDEVRADDFRERIFHPEDIQRLREERQKALSGTAPFENEQRARGKDGKYRWFLIRYNPLLDESGKVIRWYATGTDIDDRVRAEERTRNENLALREQIDRESMFEDIVGSSEALRKVLRQVTKVAPSDSTVLILGETGTGKELIARAIHKRSRRAEQAFIGVNCAAIPASLIASELFGHEKGAFTGATQRRLGRFESANGGTMFLDEVGDLPAEIQIALLRVLQEREIERVGNSRPIQIDVRVVTATHRDLNALVAEGKFREDLLYRLNVFPIEMPPLRERAADIPVLVEYFTDRFGKRAGKKFKAIDKKSLKLFEAYGWPGNVRELQNVIERAVILCEGETFSVDESWLKRELPSTPSWSSTLNRALMTQEKEMIEAALAESSGRISGPIGAAARLGLPVRTLDSKIKRLKINKYRFKSPPSD